MSFKLAAKGLPSTGDTKWTPPSAVLLTAQGNRSFYRTETDKGYTTPAGSKKLGKIQGLDWNGSSWTTVLGLGENPSASDSSSYDNFEHGKTIFEISKNGASVGYDWKFVSQDGLVYKAIEVDGSLNELIYPFSHPDSATQFPPTSSTQNITELAGPLDSSFVFHPWILRLDDTSTRRFVAFDVFTDARDIIRVTGRPSLYFASINYYSQGDYNFFNYRSLNSFEISGDGNNIFAYVGDGLRHFSWSGTAWVYSYVFTGAGNICAVNGDGSVVAAQVSGSTVVFKKINNLWTQLGAGLPIGPLWVNTAGNLLAIDTQLYAWNGSSWENQQWQAIGSLSDNATVSATAAGDSSVQRLELKDVAPIYFGGTLATAIYAGATEGQAIYYGSSLLWNVAGWEPSTLQNNLLAFYRLNDAGGGALSLADSSGNNRTLTNTGGVLLGAGVISGAASFQSTRYLSVALPFNTAQPWAISFWANISSLKNYFTLIGGESTGRLHIHGDSSGSLYLNNGFSDGVSVPNFFTEGQWAHYAFSRSGSTLSVYKNSTLVNTYNLTASYTQTSTLYIGRVIFTPDDFQFVGRMDAIGLWSRAITSAEVSQLYNNGAGMEI